MSEFGIAGPNWVYMGFVSIGTTLLLLTVLVHAWRRWGRFPSIVYKHRAISQRVIGLFWVGILAGGYLLAAAGVLGSPLGRSSRTWSQDLATLETEQPLEVGDEYDVYRLTPPFYQYSLHARVDSADTVRLHFEEAHSAPTEFLVASVLYVLLVVRWKPQNV